jgi:uncharacterized phage protein gp47/JayE
MATIPTPRSYSAITGDMLDALLSKLGFPSVRVGSGTLSIIEAAAQSDLRSSQDIFNLLNSTSLDRATGQALDRLGNDEDAPRIAQSPASGKVTISDTSFTKISTKVFQGKPPPIVGSAVLYVTDALLFPASGSVYIGRGTSNYEGPLAYTSKVNNVNYWTLNLAVSNYTTKYHNLGETVILAQGGDRLIAAGTIVQTAQANASSAVQFSVQYAATVPDGETSITGVTVIAKTPGVVGNVIAGSIKEFPSPPFTGAAVSNPSPFSNGLSTEDDNTYRERIRAVRQSRSRATPLAIKTGITGITSLEENKRVISCSIVRRQAYPTTVYLDDGTGYEEATTGIPLETLVDEALGGEQYFQLVHGRPVAKAYVVSGFAAPYELSAAMKLSLMVGGKLSEHTFSAREFRSIENASAYEVVASINANVDLTWSARTYASGTKVALFAKADTEEDVEVVEATGDFVDANTVLGFAAGRVDTLRLYKNDVLLSKDGQLAVFTGNDYGLWNSTSSGETLQIQVDNVDVALLAGTNLYTISDVDFVNAGTVYRTVSSSNSIQSWVDVLNYKIPGITAEAVGGAITLTSNRGRTSKARVAITGGTLVAKSFFPIGSVTGRDLDYTLDRNLGQIRLENSLVLHDSDRLTAGSYATRAFLESAELTTLTIAGTANTTRTGEAGAELWFVVDGAAEVITTRIGVSTNIIYIDDGAYSLGSPTFPRKMRITHWSGVSTTPGTSTLFENAKVGDWLIVYDTALPVANRGAFRITDVGASGVNVTVEFPAGSGFSNVGVALASGGMVVVRTTADLQRVYLPNATNYTATSLATAISSQLRGATAQTYRTRQFRVRTNSFLSDGDIGLVACNEEGLKLGLEVGSATVNATSHLASIEAGNPETGTPQFEIGALSTAITDLSTFDVTSLGLIEPNHILVGSRSLKDGALYRYSNGGHVTPIEYITGSTIYVRRPAVESWLPADRLYAASPYAMTSDDEMTVVVDGDTSSKRFVVPMFRRVKPGSSTYGITNDFKDADNSNLSLAKAFGTGMDWRDFAVFMPARTKSHGVPDTNKTLMWRYKRLGAEGNRARIQYIYPTAVSQTALATWSPLTSSYTDIKVRLPSGSTPRTGVTYTNSTRIGLSAQYVGGSGTPGLYNYQHVFNLPIASGTREVRLNYTGHDGSFTAGQVVSGATATGWTISFVSSSGATGYLIISGGAGTFVDGEDLNVLGTPRADASGSQYGYATLTLTTPSGITDHGFNVNDVLHIEYNGTGSGAGFLSGNRAILETDRSGPTATTIRFVEGTTGIASTSNIGTVSFDTAEVKLTGSTVAVGDIQSLGSGASVPATWVQGIKLQTVADGYTVGQSPVVPLAPDLGVKIQWHLLNSTSNIAWFPLGVTTITAIATAINAQANCPVSAFVAGDGLGDTSGSIAYATYEATPNGLGDNTADTPWYYFSDGLNWVRSNTTPLLDTLDFNFTFKNAVTSGLSSNSDWANETVRLVPITAENIAEYLSTSGPGGLFANGESAVSSRGGRPQITTLTAGSGGSVQVQGGTANSITSVVKGQAIQAGSTYAVVTVATSDTIGLSAGHWMQLQNSVAVPKARIDANTNLDSIDTDGTIYIGKLKLNFTNGTPISWSVGETVTGGTSGAVGVVTSSTTGVSGSFTFSYKTWNGVSFINGEALNGSVSGAAHGTASGSQFADTADTKAWDWANTAVNAVVASQTWQIEKQGNFVCYQWVSGSSPDLTGVQEGDWAYIHLPGTINQLNRGAFRIVRVSNTTKTFWIENANAVEETVVMSIAFLTYDSIMPDDKLAINTSAWGINNLGTWTVKSIGLGLTDSGFTGTPNRWLFTLDTTSRALTAVVSPGPGILDTSSNLVQAIEKEPSRLIKKIWTISLNPSDGSLTDIKFDSWSGGTKVSEAAGTVLGSLDKLAFSTSVASGIDGYQHSTGLIEEANKVGYGVDSDPATYPGLIAAGASVNIEGPLIHRIQVSLALRTRSGVSTRDVKSAVRSAVAAYVNAIGVGKQVSLSEVVTAAQGVNGVVAVTILSPTYSSGNDLISIQPYEKPMILNLDDDVQISFVGE